MTYSELLHLRYVLACIKIDDPRVARAKAYVEKDIALREEQKKQWKDNLVISTELHW